MQPGLEGGIPGATFGTPNPLYAYGTTDQNTGLQLGDGSYLATGSQPSVLGANTTTTPVDQNAIASYDQAIGNTQAGINRLGTQLNSGNQAIDASYTNALNQLLLSKNQGQQAYNTNQQQARTGYVGAKNTIGSQAGSSLNGLLRLLGSRGAGGSLAATGQDAGTARGEVGRGATLQRQDATSTFGQNMQGLDTNWNNFLTGYNNQVSSATSQRDQGKQSLQQQLDNNRANLLTTLADLQGKRSAAAGGSYAGGAQGSLDQANALYDQTANYTTAPINYQTQAYQAPSAASYSTNPNPTPQYSGSTPNDYFSPYLAQLLGKKYQIA